jgi:hypothetical protein
LSNSKDFKKSFMEKAKYSTKPVIKEFVQLMENIYDSDKYSSSIKDFEVAYPLNITHLLIYIFIF